MRKRKSRGKVYRKKNGKYWDVYEPNHPNATKNGYMTEQRLVMSRVLGRPLRPGEVVHHINGIQTDNRPENLEVLMRGAHTRVHLGLSAWLRCARCGKDFLRKKQEYLRRQPKGREKRVFCTLNCAGGRDKRACIQCGLAINRKRSARLAYPKAFCSQRCAMRFLNQHYDQLSRLANPAPFQRNADRPDCPTQHVQH